MIVFLAVDIRTAAFLSNLLDFKNNITENIQPTMLGRWIGSGQRKQRTDTMGITDEDADKMEQQQPHAWSVGQIVDVRARTWVG